MNQKGRANKLLKAASKSAGKAYAPYSGFLVGAALEVKDGKIFTAANMENASYGLTVCAEVGALQAASSAGYLDKVVSIGIVGGLSDPKKRNRNKIVTPCGRCRQLILESALLSKNDIEIWCADLDLTIIQRFNISELLPNSFGPKDLSK